MLFTYLVIILTMLGVIVLYQDINGVTINKRFKLEEGEHSFKISHTNRTQDPVVLLFDTKNRKFIEGKEEVLTDTTKIVKYNTEKRGKYILKIRGHKIRPIEITKIK